MAERFAQRRRNAASCDAEKRVALAMVAATLMVFVAMSAFDSPLFWLALWLQTGLACFLLRTACFFFGMLENAPAGLVLAVRIVRRFCEIYMGVFVATVTIAYAVGYMT